MSTRTSSLTDPDRELDDLRGRSEVVPPLYITAAQAARVPPPGRNGRPTHISTIIRWITTGTVSPAGETIHLRAVRMGGRWLTTREWVDDYARRLTPTRSTGRGPDPASARQRRVEQASKELDRAGI